MFYRASEGGTGSGLGLYIVKKAVEKIGGEITLQSVPGNGSAFTVSAPDMRDLKTNGVSFPER